MCPRGLAAGRQVPMSRSGSTEGSMTYGGSGDTGGAWRNDGGVQPHAFDPLSQPELFSGLLTKRVLAFLIDLVVILLPYLFAILFGILTLGLGFLLFWLAWPATV